MLLFPQSAAGRSQGEGGEPGPLSWRGMQLQAEPNFLSNFPTSTSRCPRPAVRTADYSVGRSILRSLGVFKKPGSGMASTEPPAGSTKTVGTRVGPLYFSWSSGHHCTAGPPIHPGPVSKVPRTSLLTENRAPKPPRGGPRASTAPASALQLHTPGQGQYSTLHT